MSQVLIGTTNLAKFKDYLDLLKDYDISFLSLAEVPIKPPKETGKTFEDNAVIKARHYYQKSGLPTLSDDAGFEIAALNGAPGIKSHRWLGKDSTDEKLIDAVIRKMSKIPEDKRQCRMITTIALATPFGIVTSEGSVDGIVAVKPSKRLIKGYPYRSVMYLPNYKKYFSELTRSELEILNHRKAAIEKIKDIFKELK